ncbi:MAG: diacylglycerol kinase family lipid kinase [Thermodesulfobacteriota bacterium]|nr:diacylglycerol kinase family lipid kinase [Thermodesulfobacteriota bacterium]
MKTIVIANPASGGRRYRKIVPNIQRILNERGIHYSFFLSQYPGNIEEIVKKVVQDGFQRVIACGGDGTVHEAVNGIMGTDIPLGIIPMGKGGDLALNLGIDRDITAAIDIISKNHIRKIDIVKVNGGRYFLGLGGIGFDSEVTKWVNKRMGFLKCKCAYTIASIARIPGYKHKRVKIQLDDEHFDGQVLLVAFGNSKTYGGGMYITPDAEMDDGLLDICVIRKINKFKLLYMFPKVFKGNHIRVSEVKMSQSKAVSVESDIPLDLYGDGEFICTTPFSLEVIPDALNVIVPFQ